MIEPVRALLPGGTPISGVLAAPDRTPAPGVVVLHEITGIDRAIKDACLRLADSGYVAFAPDLYSRRFRPICIANTLLSLARNQPAPVADLMGCLSWLRARPDVSGPSVVLGFCMGGGYALALAVHADLAVGAINYGGVPLSAEELVGVCPIVASYGTDDKRFVVDGRRLEQLLQQLRVPNDVHIYPGATHSFMNNRRGAVAARLFGVRYDPDAAEDAWRRTLAFLNASAGAASAALGVYRIIRKPGPQARFSLGPWLDARGGAGVSARVTF